MNKKLSFFKQEKILFLHHGKEFPANLTLFRKVLISTLIFQRDFSKNLSLNFIHKDKEMFLFYKTKDFKNFKIIDKEILYVHYQIGSTYNEKGSTT